MEPTGDTRPFLEPPFDASETDTLLNWVKYLGSTFGTGGALNALRYYERLAWISPPARAELEAHLQGLSQAEIHSKKYDEPASLTSPLTALSGTAFGAHAKSLAFIASIADDDLESEVLRAKLAKHQVDVTHADPVATSGEAGTEGGSATAGDP